MGKVVTIKTQRRLQYEAAVEIANDIQWLIDAMYSHEDPHERMEMMTAARNKSKSLTRCLTHLVENNPR